MNEDFCATEEHEAFIESWKTQRASAREIEIVRADRVEQPILSNLMQLYAYDFSEILGFEVEENGRFAERSLDVYWQESWRFPFFIRREGRLAGFALVHGKSKLSGADDVWDIAEFLVLRKHRRAGVGLEAARQLFARHKGKWEVRQRLENVGASAFWRKAIAEYSRGCFTEVVLDDERWRGPIQCFTS